MKGWVAGLVVVMVIVFALLLVGGSYFSAKNTMVAKSEDVRQAYAQVDVIQQQRMDLIPNLVASVKGYVNEETTVLTNIANARAGVIAAQGNQAASVQANQKLDVAISPLLRLQEAYPNLKSNEQFRMLTDNLAGMENRLAVERRRYDRTLEDYNVYIQQFPNSIWAGMAGFHYRDEYFKADPEARQAPKVDFGK
jgi:LemA protein